MAYKAGLPQGKTKVSTMRAIWKWALIFVVFGLLLYIALLAYADKKIRETETGEHNPFFQIAMNAEQGSDVVILGASHAMPLGFDGIKPLIEQTSGRNLMVMAIEGGGVVPNGVILDALLKKSKPRTVIYVLDTFAFLSPQWNEERLNDSEFYARTPFDRAILDTFLAEGIAWRNVASYLAGFDRINRPSSSGVDRSEALVAKFDQTYSPDDNIEDQRVADLFSNSSAALMQGYVDRLAAMAAAAKQAGSEFILLQMPVPPRYTSRLPETHQAVLDRVQAVAEAQGVCVIDHTEALPGDENYSDTDHLNRIGAERYAVGLLAEALLLPAGEATESPSPWCVDAASDEDEDTTEEDTPSEEDE